jgi:hypothetical protein
VIVAVWIAQLSNNGPSTPADAGSTPAGRASLPHELAAPTRSRKRRPGLRSGEKAELAHLLEALRAEGLSILLVEHDMDFVMGLVDRTVVMDFGAKLCEGTPAVVRSDPRVQEAYLGGVA